MDRRGGFEHFKTLALRLNVAERDTAEAPTADARSAPFDIHAALRAVASAPTSVIGAEHDGTPGALTPREAPGAGRQDPESTLR
jgi:hypothetical protein